MHSNTPNRLVNEKSLYLIQHAYNPVDWFPWGEEAFAKSIAQDKPIFLSIGYSTCHWCHVMERESFENQEVASILNQNFISIKVDREERPDIDHIYMLTCQLMNGNGGWPLNLFLTPSLKPFFAGTYFPPTGKYGRVGFKDLLQNISKVWIEKKEEILESSNQFVHYLNSLNSSSATVDITDQLFNSATNYFITSFDKQYGGFGTHPKFPSPHNLMYLLRDWKYNGNAISLQMAAQTLTALRFGGIFDHIGFGFHRYSTDKQWLVPHFEKMLYDQAMLIRVYSEAYLATKQSLFKQTAEEIIEYVLRDLTSSEGAFYTAEDADSEGIEGKFYTWRLEELELLLNKDELSIAQKVFNIKEEGNFLDEAKRILTKENIPHSSLSIAELAALFNMDQFALEASISKIRSILFNNREKRIHPLKDTKVLTDLNGMMISSLAYASRAFNNNSYLIAAQKAFEFINNTLIAPGNILLHRFKDGQAIQNGFIDDYAFIIFGLLELFQSTMDENYLNKAIELTDVAIAKFWDDVNGGFYFAMDKSTDLIARSKEYYDGAIPSANSVMAHNFNKLTSLTFNQKYQQYFTMLINSNGQSIAKAPHSFAFTMCALIENKNECQIIVADNNIFDPNEIVYHKINNTFLPSLNYRFLSVNNKLPQNFESYTLLNDSVTYYYCKNRECQLPTNNASQITNLIE